MKRVIIFISVLLLAGCATTDSYVKQDGAALTEQERAQVKVICGNRQLGCEQKCGVL